jgi:hypothetical protein
MKAAMRRINFWSRSLSRVELDQRSREVRLRRERLEQLLISHAAVRQSRRRLLSFGVGRYTHALQERRISTGYSW